MSLVARCTPSSWMEPLIVPETGIMSAPRKRTISALLSTQVSSLARRLEGCDIRHIQRDTGMTDSFRPLLPGVDYANAHSNDADSPNRRFGCLQETRSCVRFLFVR